MVVDKHTVFADKDVVIAFLNDHLQMRPLVKYCRPFSFWVPKW